MSSDFKWTDAKEKAAIALANGETQIKAAETAGITTRSIRNWMNIPEFSAEVDRLSHMVGIANRAHRLRMVNRVIKQKIANDGYVMTDKDILDWFKFAQSETDGVKLDLMALFEATQADD
jgi:hypothetical protein